MKKILTLILSTLVLLSIGIVNVCADTYYHDTKLEGDQASLTDSTSTRYYASLSKALDDAESIENCTVKLLKDITSNGSESMSNKSEFCIDGGTFTFDGGGNTIAMETTGSNKNGNYVILCRANVAFKNLIIRKGTCSEGNVLKGGVNVINDNKTINVTFDNCDIDVIDNANKWGLSAIIVGKNANVTVNSGTYNGGKADGSDWQGINIGANNAFTFASGTTNGINADDIAAKFAVKGGTHGNIGFKAKDGNTCKGITGGTFANNPAQYVNDDCEVIDNGNSTWTVVEKEVAKIDTTIYPSLTKALEAVPANNTETVTIELLKDIVLNETVDINKNNVVLDGKGKSITADPNYNGFDIYEVGGSEQTLGSATLISVSGKNVTVKNLTVDVKQYRGLSCVTTKGGENVTYENNTYLGRGCGHYYGTGKGKILFDNCTINTQGYGIHFSGDSGKYEIEIKDSTVHGWNSFGGATKITATKSKFLSANDEDVNGLLAKFRPYTKAVLTDCEFSVDYTKDDDNTIYCGLDTGAETSVEFYNCSMINNDGSKNLDHEIYEIVDYIDNDCANNSVFTFYPKDCEKNDYKGLVVVTRLNNVPVPSGYKAIKLDSVKSTYDEKEYVYTVERRKASDEGNVIVIDTEDEEIPAYYENAKDLQDAVNNVIEANEKKEAKKEEVAPTTITVANNTRISAEIDDTIVIIAKDNTESPNVISGVVGYNVNEEILNKGTTEEKTKYTASALNIGEYVAIVEDKKVVKKDGSGSKGSQKTETTKSEEEGVNASDKVLASAGTVNDIEGVDKDCLSGIVADIVKNSNNEMLALKLNQATAAKAINNAAEDIKGKDVSNVVVTTNGEVKAKDISIFVKTYYETVITEDKTSQENKSFKFDIKPMYQAYASTANNINDAFNLEKDAVTVTMGEPKELSNLSGKNITLTFKLPEGFMTSLDQKVFVIHTLADKTQRKYNTIVTKEGNDFVISFVNPDGFSEFEFTLENPKKPQSKRYVVPVTGIR